MKLNRANLATKTGVVAATPTERIVHIGLGAFHRAHQAWFTAQVDSNNDWGIVAFTGRSAKAAEELASQDGLFTLITRSEDGDKFEIVDSIVRAEDGNDTEAFTSAITNPQTAIVTLTITEAGLAQCAAIVVLVGGAGKAVALREIACGEFAPQLHPGQVLRAHASRVTWLADQEAAAGL